MQFVRQALADYFHFHKVVIYCFYTLYYAILSIFADWICMYMTCRHGDSG